MAVETPEDSKLVLTDEDFLAIVAEERRQSVGLDSTGEGSSELSANRERALEYIKGEMPDLPSLPNRSSAVSTDVSDAIETALPDIMEVLTGGDDVATFKPNGEADVERAAEETDYVNHVLMNKNDGWRVIQTMVRDALSVKIGVVKVWDETDEEIDEERFEGKTSAEIVMIRDEIGDQVEIEDLENAGEPDPQTGEALWNFTLRQTRKVGRVCTKEVAPEDFAVAKDTVIVRDATYCVMRSRQRAQDLIRDGYDPEDVDALSPYGSPDGEAIEVARDTAGEHDGASSITSSREFNLHQVEVFEHYIRVDADDDGVPELWCVVTGADETVLLKKERVDRIPFAVATPFMVPHRLFGRSLYDILGEIQKIKTALVRLMLDSGYFAMNQRYEVATGKGKANSFTIPDLLNNIPGAPVRSEDGQSVRALGGSRLDFDVTGALEYVSTMGEQRSGIVRNAQGLNPDTLHETAKGAMALIGAAQKRIRMVCRTFAETGIKDLILLIHDTARSVVTADNFERGGKWVDVDPSGWSERREMTIHVGIGSGGREQELAALNLVAERQAQLVALQGGQLNGPFIFPENLYQTMKRLIELAGLKSPSLYVTQPPPRDPNAPPPEAPPDPEIVKAQMDDARERYKIDVQAQLDREEMERKDARERDQLLIEADLKREQFGVEARLKAVGALVGGGSDVHFGGEPG